MNARGPSDREARRALARTELSRVLSTRARLLELHPFWGAMLRQMRVVMSDALPALSSTDGVSQLFFNPRHTQHLNERQLAFTVAFNLAHIAFETPHRREERIPALWEQACHRVIRAALMADDQHNAEAGFPTYEDLDIILPGLGRIHSDLGDACDDMSIEQAYEHLFEPFRDTVLEVLYADPELQHIDWNQSLLDQVDAYLRSDDVRTESELDAHERPLSLDNEETEDPTPPLRVVPTPGDDEGTDASISDTDADEPTAQGVSNTTTTTPESPQRPPLPGDTNDADDGRDEVTAGSDPGARDPHSVFVEGPDATLAMDPPDRAICATLPSLDSVVDALHQALQTREASGGNAPEPPEADTPSGAAADDGGQDGDNGIAGGDGAHGDAGGGEQRHGAAPGVDATAAGEAPLSLPMTQPPTDRARHDASHKTQRALDQVKSELDSPASMQQLVQAGATGPTAVTTHVDPNGGPGETTPGPGHRRWAGELRRGVLPWPRLLERYSANSPDLFDYSYRRPVRRYLEQGLIVPGGVGQQVNNIVVAIDTSDSIAANMLGLFKRELRAIVELADELTVLTCDNEVRQAVRNDQVAAWIHRGEFHGGEGTDHRPVFEWIEAQRLSPDLLICFTDLDSYFPLKAPPYPVIWVCEETAERTPSFGHVVFVPSLSESTHP